MDTKPRPDLQKLYGPQMSSEDAAKQKQALDMINQIDALRHTEKRPELRRHLLAAINCLVEYGAALAPAPDMDHDGLEGGEL